jgi:hypothetical protein
VGFEDRAHLINLVNSQIFTIAPNFELQGIAVGNALCLQELNVFEGAAMVALHSEISLELGIF